MNNPGTTVYVHWYGKLLQGTVVNDNDLMGMVAVRIPLMGCHPVALFTPAHVYESETAANGILAGEPHKKLAEDRTATPCKDSMPGDVPTSSSKANPPEAWQAIQKFKQEHWDQERNHLRIDAVEEFYQLWRAAIAVKYGVTIEEPSVTVIAADPGLPDGDRSGAIIVDTETGEILPELPPEAEHRPVPSEERYQQLKEKMKVKLTKKQLRSTGSIQYSDSIQTSLFD